MSGSSFRKVEIPDEVIVQLRNEIWDVRPLLERGEPPVPKVVVRCPRCGSTFVCIKHFMLHERPRHGNVRGLTWRVDVWFKCMKCSMVWVHGVPLTYEEYRIATSKVPERSRDWTSYGHICQDVNTCLN